MMGGYGGGMWFGWIWPVIMMVGVAAVAWGLMHRRSSSGDGTRSAGHSEGGPVAGRPPGEDHAREILRERYARWEISEGELRERMGALGER